MANLLKQSMEIFETPKTIEKWDSFIQLISLKWSIELAWFNKLKTEIDRYFTINDKHITLYGTVPALMGPKNLC